MMLKNKNAKRENKHEERTNTLQSGLFFWINDCGNNTKQSQELDLILKKNNLSLKLATSNSGRKAYYLTLPDHVSSFTVQSLYPELDRKSHITIDCEYYKEYAPINDRLKWHYCHYTEEYYAPPSKELVFSVHQYFNKLGNTVLTTITCKKTEKTMPISEEQNRKIHLNLEHAKNIVSELINAKNIATAQYTRECNHLFDLVASSTASAHANQKSIDSGIIEANISDFKSSAKLARRYADNFLQLPEKYLINLLATINQGIKHDENISHAKEPEINPIRLEKINEPIISRIETITKEYKSLQNQLSELNKSNQAFLKPAELDGIMFAAWDILNKLVEIVPNQTEHKTYTAIVINITKFIKKLSKPGQTIQSKLKGKPQDILEIFQYNFHAIEKDIPPDFYFDVLNKTVECKDKNSRYYINICDFLSHNSEKYLAILRPPYYSHPENNKDSIYHILHKSFLEQNPMAFEMLLKHGVKLGGKVFSEDANFAISLTKCLVKDFSFDLAKHGDSNLHQTIEYFEIFLKIMIDPRFRAGLEHVNSLTGNLSNEALKSRTPKDRQANSDTKNDISKFFEKNVSIASVLDFSLDVGLPGSIVKLIADNTCEKDITLFYLARNFAHYALGNSVAIVINDTNDHLERITHPNMAQETTDYINYFFKRYAEEATGTISPRIYLEALNLKGNPPEEVHEAMRSIINLFNAKLEKTSEADYKRIIEALLNEKQPKDLSRYFGAIFLLVANNSYDKNWKLLKLYNSLLQAADCCFENQEFDNQSLIKYVYFFHANVLYNELQKQPDTPENQNLINKINADQKFEPTQVRDLALMYKLLKMSQIQICGKPRP